VILLENELKVSASYITKKFEMHKKKSDKTKATFKKSKNKAKDFWALRGVSFDVYSGDTVGIVGTNGSGKSTLSNIISGTSTATTGDIFVKGKTSIIAIGSGLKKELTGRENIKLKCLLSGMTSKEIDAITDDIIAFAELDDFIDQPLKNYSSGMKSRLGFSISVHQEPDILIIDEALSVGDATFYQKCIDKMFEFKEQGKTIFFVNHSSTKIREFCDKAIWLHDGEMKAFGLVDEVVDAYKEHVAWYKSLPRTEQRAYKKANKEERRNFDLDNYYQETLRNDLVTDREKLEEMFYPTKTIDKMKFSVKMLASCILIVLLLLGLNYVATRPLIEIIFG